MNINKAVELSNKKKKQFVYAKGHISSFHFVAIFIETAIY